MQIYADFAWLEARTLNRNVLISVEDGFITGIRRNVPSSEIAKSDLRRAELLLPGFINAHCHLEYSCLEGKLSRNPPDFASWLKEIVSAGAESHNIGIRNAAMAKAATSLRRGGCTTVIDCSTDGSSEAFFADAGLRHVMLFECLGLTQERAQPQLERALHLIDRSGTGLCAGRGLAPHSPYSVGTWLLDQLEKMAATPGCPAMAWHLAESREELELLKNGTGPIADFLRASGFPLSFSDKPKNADSPYELLSRHGLAKACTQAIHGNLLSSSETSQFKSPRSIVYCPTTHDWFKRPRVKLPEMLSEGSNVCLGTDSLASSATLDMLDVIRLTGHQYPELTGPQLLNLVTRNPGRAWPFARNPRPQGTIELNAVADFVALRPAVKVTDLSATLSSEDTTVDWTIIAGSD